jgi:multidrug efflux pump subunit AcrA (membrane-fusion protein)
VREQLADLGQYVGPAQPLARVYAADYAEVRLPVPDDQLTYLDLPFAYRNSTSEGRGASVRLTATFAGGAHEWTGRLVRTAGEIDPRTRTLTLIARVDNPYAETRGGRPPLAVGMFVEARNSGRRGRARAIQPRAALRDGATPRQLVQEGERLRLRDAHVVRPVGEFILVAGLPPGTSVCISPLEAPTEGMRVRTTLEPALGPAVLAERRP